jgi:ferredoxin-NADP reductase
VDIAGPFNGAVTVAGGRLVPLSSPLADAWRDRTVKTLLCLAGGSGITPIFSVRRHPLSARHVADHRDDMLHVLHCTRRITRRS